MIRTPRSAACAAALLLGPALASAQSTFGVLDANGVALDNGVVRFHFFKGAGGTAELDVVDLARGHTYRHRGADLWQMDVVDTLDLDPGISNNELFPILPSDCNSIVNWRLTQLGGDKEIELKWSNCSEASMGTDSAGVQLLVELAAGEAIADWTLTATSNMSRFTFWSGRIRLSIEEDAANGDHFFLDPLSYLTRNPAVNLPDWALGTPTSPTVSFEVLHYPAQLAAYYDANRNGLFMSGGDEGGFMPRSFHYKSVDPGGGGTPRLEHEAIYYLSDFSNPGADYAGAPMRIGRFNGDWFDAAVEYRDWVASVDIASSGLLVDRTDIADLLKNIQQGLAFSPSEDFSASNPNERSIPEGIQTYLDYWGLDHVISTNFGANWAVNDGCGVGKYELDPAWTANIDMMVAAGLPFCVYVADTMHAFAPDPIAGCPSPFCTIDNSFWDDGFDTAAMLDVDGSIKQIGDCTNIPYALIDPSTDLWEARMIEVAQALGNAGLEGVYIDNVFPDYTESCFATTHGHAPGLGTYYPEGQVVNTLDAWHDNALPDGTFIVFTEVGMEAQIRHNGQSVGISPFGDFHGDVTEMGNVPAYTVAFHEFSVPNAGRADTPWLLTASQLAGSLPFEDTVWHTDPGEQEDGRRGAMYATAYTIVNGGWLITPDQNVLDPKQKAWSFEFELGDDPPQHLVDGLAHYQDVVEYVNVGSAYRGSTSAQPFLNVGRRMRDLPFVTTIPTVVVPHRVWVLPPPYNSTQEKPVPALLQAVWQDVQTGDLGLAFANHSASTVSGQQFGFRPQSYGLHPTDPYQIIRVQPGQPDQAVGSGAGQMLVNLPTMPSESFLFFIVRQ